ncbi:MAG: hypothetical protein ACRD2L_03235, partial [Terriglobia bacterium]
MGIQDWLNRKGSEKSASNIRDGLRPLIAAARADYNIGHEEFALIRAGKGSDSALLAQRFRSAKERVFEAQRKLYQDITVWSTLPPERVFNDVILPALLSGEL